MNCTDTALTEKQKLSDISNLKKFVFWCLRVFVSPQVKPFSQL